MWVTTDQAAEMYARFCRARYGGNAKQVVEAKIVELRDGGDAEGEQVWTKVKHQIEIQSKN